MTFLDKSIILIGLTSLAVFLLLPFRDLRGLAEKNLTVGVFHHVFALLGVASVATIWSIFVVTIWRWTTYDGLGGFFAPLVSATIVLLLHAVGYRASFKRGWLAMALMAASAVLQAYIFASGAIAGCTGFSLGESLLILIDSPTFVFKVMRAYTSAAELWCYGLALILAFLLGVKKQNNSAAREALLV